MITRNADAEITTIAPGVTRKILSYTKELMVCEVKLEKGSVVASHQHPHTQSTYVISGSCQVETNGKVETLNAGDSILFLSNQPHAVTAPEDAVVLDLFSPMREDFLG